MKGDTLRPDYITGYRRAQSIETRRQKLHNRDGADKRRNLGLGAVQQLLALFTLYKPGQREQATRQWDYTRHANNNTMVRGGGRYKTLMKQHTAN